MAAPGGINIAPEGMPAPSSSAPKVITVKSVQELRESPEWAQRIAARAKSEAMHMKEEQAHNMIINKEISEERTRIPEIVQTSVTNYFANNAQPVLDAFSAVGLKYTHVYSIKVNGNLPLSMTKYVTWKDCLDHMRYISSVSYVIRDNRHPLYGSLIKVKATPQVSQSVDVFIHADHNYAKPCCIL